MTADTRIRWRCRRGMREMDVILERFLESEAGYRTLDAEGRERFEAMLDLSDQLLYNWIIGSESVPDATLRGLSRHIRDTAFPDSAPSGGQALP